MKNLLKITLACVAIFGFNNINAQFDDVYEDNTTNENSTYYNQNTNTNNDASVYDAPDKTESYYDEDGDTYITNNYYNEYEEEEYYYSKNLRRYYAPTYHASYYDFYYTDYYAYDPFYSPQYYSHNTYRNPWYSNWFFTFRPGVSISWAYGHHTTFYNNSNYAYNGYGYGYNNPYGVNPYAYGNTYDYYTNNNPYCGGYGAYNNNFYPFRDTYEGPRNVNESSSVETASIGSNTSIINGKGHGGTIYTSTGHSKPSGNIKNPIASNDKKPNIVWAKLC